MVCRNYGVVQAKLENTEARLRNAEVDLGSEQMLSSALETGFSRVRVILDSDSSFQSQIRQIREIAFGVPGAPGPNDD